MPGSISLFFLLNFDVGNELGRAFAIIALPIVAHMLYLKWVDQRRISSEKEANQRDLL